MRIAIIAHDKRSDLDAQATLLDARLPHLYDLLTRPRSVRRAAEILGQAQPTASIRLGRLRKELGDPLFVRTAKGLQPTPRADALIGAARSAIGMLQRLTQRDEEFVPGAARAAFASR